MYPADPLAEVGIVAGEADEAEGILQEGLTDGVYEGRGVAGVLSVVLVGDGEVFGR